MPAAVRAYPMLAASVALAVGPSPAGAGAPPPGRSAPAEPPGGLLCRDGLPDREPDAVPRTEVAEHPLQQRPVLQHHETEGPFIVSLPPGIHRDPFDLERECA